MDVNRFARSTSWAHGAMADYLQRFAYPLGVGTLVMAFLLVMAWLSARRSPEHLSGVIWAALGGAAAYGLSPLLSRELAQVPPFHVLKHVEVLVQPSQLAGFPDARAAICGAVVCGLVLARRWLLLVPAVLAGLLVCFAGVYVGLDYPSDVGGGAVFGAVVVLVLWPLTSRVLGFIVAGLAGSPLRALVESARGPSYHPGSIPAAGPARLPNAKAMAALRAASEAARAQPPVSAPSSAPDKPSQ